MFAGISLLFAVASMIFSYSDGQPPILSRNTSSVLFPFGTSAGDTLGPFSDDSSSNVIYLKEVFKFAGREYSEIIVNSNGVLSLGEVGFNDLTPRPFPFLSPPLIAPFWFDLNPSAGGSISYRVSNDSELLSSFNSLWEQLNVGDLTNFIPTNLFIATWYQVPVYRSDSLGVGNSFQVVLATDTVKTVALFIYGEINDGSGAQVGFNIGDGYSSYSLPGALSDQTLLLDDNSNSGKTGFYIFRLDNITTVQCSTTVDCAVSDLGMMTPRDCCIGTQSSLAYTVPGSAECHPCVDINECANSSLNDCLESNNQVCVNYNVSRDAYTCLCMDGFEEDDNMICQDIDECNVENGNCSQICNNTPGSYSCECNNGYNLDELDNSTCHDIDECRIGTDNCHTNANCENTLESFVCQCKSLYEGDGVNCVVSESVIIGSILGSVSFLLIGGIVLTSIFLFYCFRHAYQKRLRYLAPLDTDENDSKGNMQERVLSVQSSYKLKLPPHLIITSSTLKLVETIGQGEFGIVYKGYIVRNAGSGEVVTSIVAIKTLKGFYDSAAVREMLKESAEMYKFDHPNVLTLTGVCLDGGPTPYIIMPFMTNGSLLAYLKKNRATLVVFSNDIEEEELESVRKQLLDMCIQVARGMEYLAMMKVVHRDLAARNCMIDMNFVIKVADFGLAESVGTKDYFRQDKETVVKLPLKWLAPESMEDYVFSEKSDVWAYGVTCWEICSGGKVPYPSVDLMELPTLLVNGHRLNKPKNDACSDDMYMAMMNCWEYEPDKRPSFSSLVVSLSQYLEGMAEYMDMGTSLSKALEANEVEVKTESNDSTKGEGKKVDVPEVIVSTSESTL